MRGIVEGIDWADLPLGTILTAYDVEEAKEAFRSCKVHILLSDIDMPDHNGIQLLRWVKEVSPETETIFLTGHADFAYAQQALQLDSFDYLLKPIDHRHIKSTLRKAIEKIRSEERQREFHRTYEYYYQQWNKQLPILIERFWQDVMNLRIPLGAAPLENAYSLYGIPLTAEDRVRIVLISVEAWNEALTTRDEEIMTYAIKNAGEEIILKQLRGQVIQEASGVLLAIVYAPTPEDRATLGESCKLFIEMCRSYLHSEISCYVGEPVDVRDVHGAVRQLFALERNTLCRGGSVIWQVEEQEASAAFAFQPSFQDWAVLLESDKSQELLLRMDAGFRQMEKAGADAYLLEGYYHGLAYMVYDVLQKKSISMKEVYRDADRRDAGSIVRSVSRLREWAVPFVRQAADYIQGHNKAVSAFTQKAIRYIEAHLAEDIHRDDLAKHVYLNPAYLSRLFKKETGLSITDYILEARVAKAKPMLESTGLKIGEIAAAVGYDNFSHFTKMFKKATGLTPIEYRRIYQRVES